DLAPLLVLVYGGYQAIHQQLSPGDLAAAYAFLERIYGPLRRLVNSSTTLTQAIASMDRVFELMDEKYDIATRGALHCAPMAHQTIGTLKQGAVRFSPGIFNTMDQVVQCIRALEQLSLLK
ncbi:MAG: hypothetical protein FWJ59_05420, partial [Caldicoprobacter sp.]